ncbi:MAG: murein biosynthesis integral membrane protein MurJ [Gemmatimonadales bacterium]|nr:murein biosynthesis integral membrane protein MurJ [Gemmatimonadales bacterium]
MTSPEPPRRGAATLVAVGILASRLAGLVRQRVLAHFLGLSDAADAFSGAFRIPNLLQNLFGEGVLSASFIPVYARLEAEGRHEEARRVAGAVAGLLGCLVAVVVAVGVTASPWLVHVLVPGFEGPKQELAERLVRILFPGAGFLVLSAWCLGILNSHRRFFLSYAAPVVWNAAILAAVLLPPAGVDQDTLVRWAAWGAVAGGLLQFLIQVPTILRLTGGVPLGLGRGDPNVRVVRGNFFSALFGRGVVQISAFIDAILASFLGRGAVAALGNAQMLYTLPISLFGMSVAAAELPALSADAGAGTDAHRAMRERLERAMPRVAYFIVPSAVALAGLGHVLAGAVFQTGAFTASDARYVWGILAGSATGLLAGTLGRLYSSAWYALHDTRTPLKYAIVRVGITTVLGLLAALVLPGLLGLDEKWGTAGLTASAGVAGWVEFFLLRRGLDGRIGVTRLPPGLLPRLWGAALAGCAASWGVLLIVGDKVGPVLTAAMVLLPFGLVYLGGTVLLNVPLAREVTRRFLAPK